MTNVSKLQARLNPEVAYAMLRKAQSEIADLRAQIAELEKNQAVTLEVASKTSKCAAEDWNPVALEQHGWERNFHAGLRSTPFFEVLREKGCVGGRTNFLLLFPSVFSEPLHFHVDGTIKVD